MVGEMRQIQHAYADYFNAPEFLAKRPGWSVTTDEISGMGDGVYYANLDEGQLKLTRYFHVDGAPIAVEVRTPEPDSVLLFAAWAPGEAP